MSCGVCNNKCKGKHIKEDIPLCFKCYRIYLAFVFL